jgi:hypothetical protein
MLNFGAVISAVTVGIGPLVLAVLGVAAVVVGVFVAVLGADRVLSMVSGDDQRFGKRYEREHRERDADAEQRYREYAYEREHREAFGRWW